MINSYAILAALIKKTIPLTNQDLMTLERIFDEKTFVKNELIISEGQRVNHLYFLVSGFLRSYYFTDGKGITTKIYGPKQFASIFNAYLSDVSSQENLVAITDGVLLRISKENLALLCHTEPKWASIGQVIYQNSLAIHEEHSKNMFVLSGEERYLNLLKNYPEMIQVVPLQYLASYIGITPESLSRIRKKIIS